MGFQDRPVYRGGRKPGTKNKRTDLHAKCESVGLDVFSRMLELAMAARDTDEEWGKLRELASYLYAKPKEIELTADQVRSFLENAAHEPSRSA